MCGSLQLALHTYSFYTKNIVYFAVSILGWIAFVAVYSTAYSVSHISTFFDFSGSGLHLLSQPIFWLIIPVVTVAALLIDVLCLSVNRVWQTPLSFDSVVQEWDRYGALFAFCARVVAAQLAMRLVAPQGLWQDTRCRSWVI